MPWMALLSLLMAVFLGSLDQSVANTALPAIGEALQSTPAESVWVVHAYQLAVVAVLLPLAALGDRWGPRKVFLLGIVLFNLAALASASATQLEWLAFFRAIQGVGAAGVMSVNLALIQHIYPPEKLGRGAGMNALIVGLGYSLGPTVASLLLAVLPWPWLFGLQAPLGMVGLLLAWRYLPRTVPAKSDAPYDRVLALLAAVCFASLVFTLSAVAQQKGWAVVLTALGLMLGALSHYRFIGVIGVGSSDGLTLSARWLSPEGREIAKAGQTLTPSAPTVATFTLAQPQPWPVGTYSLEVAINDRVVETRSFEVR